MNAYSYNYLRKLNCKVKLYTEQLSKIKFNVEQKIDNHNSVTMRRNTNSRKNLFNTTAGNNFVHSNSGKKNINKDKLELNTNVNSNSDPVKN